ncbi:hypothetical protein U1Q18_028927 [Sarracenia purpurea var. burkii]
MDFETAQIKQNENLKEHKGDNHTIGASGPGQTRNRAETHLRVISRDYEKAKRFGGRNRGDGRWCEQSSPNSQRQIEAKTGLLEDRRPHSMVRRRLERRISLAMALALSKP